MANFKIIASLYLDIGPIRENNEDNFYFNGRYNVNYNEKKIILHECSLDNVQIYSVFDGMGGEEHGEVASLIAAQKLKKYHQKLRTNKIKNINDLIINYIIEANKYILKKSKKYGGVTIGTTVTSLCFIDNIAVVFNVGDSRAYLLRDDKINQLSEDHTLAQLLVRIGLLKKEEIKNKNGLTQYLGVNPIEFIVKPHKSVEINIKKDDIFLLCSDGLTDVLDDEEIKSILSLKRTDLNFIVNKLVTTALDKGCKDNITVVVIKVDDI